MPWSLLKEDITFTRRVCQIRNKEGNFCYAASLTGGYLKGVTKNKAAQTKKLCSAQAAQQDHYWSLYDLWYNNDVPMCQCVSMNSEWTQNVKNTSGCIRPP